MIHRRPRSSHFFIVAIPSYYNNMCVTYIISCRYLPIIQYNICIVTIIIIKSVVGGAPVAVVSPVCGARERSEK